MQFEPQDPDFERRVRDSFARQPFMEHIGATLTRVEPGLCEIQLPYNSFLTQQHGFFHAGATGSIADSAGGYAAYSLMPKNASVMSVEYKLNLIARADGDLLRAVGRVVKAGRTLSVCEVDVLTSKGEEENLCATALMTMITLEGWDDGPQLGPNGGRRQVTD